MVSFHALILLALLYCCGGSRISSWGHILSNAKRLHRSNRNAGDLAPVVGGGPRAPAHGRIGPLTMTLRKRSDLGRRAQPSGRADAAAVARAAALAAAVLLAQSVTAESDLGLADLDAGGGQSVAAPVTDLSPASEPIGQSVAAPVTDLSPAFEPIKMKVVGVDDAKPKKVTPASRLKELQAKKDLTDKEKKELRRLKADEMCELLGKGC